MNFVYSFVMAFFFRSAGQFEKMCFFPSPSLNLMLSSWFMWKGKRMQSLGKHLLLQEKSFWHLPYAWVWWHRVPTPRKEFPHQHRDWQYCGCWCHPCAGLWSLTGSVEEVPLCPFFPDMSAGPKGTFLLAESSHGTLLKKLLLAPDLRSQCSIKCFLTVPLV